MIYVKLYIEIKVSNSFFPATLSIILGPFYVSIQYGRQCTPTMPIRATNFYLAAPKSQCRIGSTLVVTRQKRTEHFGKTMQIYLKIKNHLIALPDTSDYLIINLFPPTFWWKILTCILRVFSRRRFVRTLCCDTRPKIIFWTRIPQGKSNFCEHLLPL